MTDVNVRWGTGVSALDRLRQAQQERNQQRNEPRIFNLWRTKQPSLSKIWFVTDVDRMIVPLIHHVPEGGKYGRDVTCARANSEDPVELCEYCHRKYVEKDEKVFGPWMNPMALVWLEQILYYENPNNSSLTLETKKINGKLVWIQTVNELRLFRLQRKDGYTYFFDQFLTGNDDLRNIDLSGDEDSESESVRAPERSLLAQPFKLIVDIQDGRAVTTWDKFPTTKALPDGLEVARAQDYDMGAIVRRNYGNPKFYTPDEVPSSGFNSKSGELVTF